jgi:hypothetical protein
VFWARALGMDQILPLGAKLLLYLDFLYRVRMTETDCNGNNTEVGLSSVTIQKTTT